MRKKQKIDLILHSILERKKNLLDKMTELSEADNSPVLENIQKEIEKSQVLEETYQEITDNKENTLSDMVQEKIATQGALTRIKNLSGSISEAEHNRVKFLTLIKRVDERIAQRLDKSIVQSELEYKKRADDEALRKKNIIYQLNADQEQRERIL
jgi:hypothetical protein